MSVNNSGVAGVVLTSATVGQGVSGWLTQNSTIISLALTALSCMGGLIFLYLNWKENKRRNDILEAKENG